jgi:hypothetical protein
MSVTHTSDQSFGDIAEFASGLSKPAPACPPWQMALPESGERRPETHGGFSSAPLAARPDSTSPARRLFAVAFALGSPRAGRAAVVPSDSPLPADIRTPRQGSGRTKGPGEAAGPNFTAQAAGSTDFNTTTNFNVNKRSSR